MSKITNDNPVISNPTKLGRVIKVIYCFFNIMNDILVLKLMYIRDILKCGIMILDNKPYCVFP